MNPLVEQLSHRPFPDLAAAIRARVADIVREWNVVARRAVPQLDRLSYAELEDSVPNILRAIADALESGDPDQISALLDYAPQQGLTRFRQRFDVRDVMQEDRLLRSVIVAQVEEQLTRQMTQDEAAALHAAIDLMQQRAIVALVDEQKAELRQAAERELTFLSFLSHDLNNNLSSVTLTLRVLRGEFADSCNSEDAIGLIKVAEGAIQATVRGMRRLLEHERLHKAGAKLIPTTLQLQSFLAELARQFETEAREKKLRVVVDADPAAAVQSDPELVSLVMRNLIGNALKYSSRGTVRIRAQREAQQSQEPRWALSVSDEGPGIAPEHLGQIFDAFKRGRSFGQQGVGLGLAIASQAARLLGAELTVESKVGSGSTFYLRLPPPPDAGRGD